MPYDPQNPFDLQPFNTGGQGVTTQPIPDSNPFDLRPYTPPTPQEQSWGQWLTSMGIRTIPAVAGFMTGGPFGAVLGGALGEAGAESYEGRQLNPAMIGLQGGLNAIPFANLAKYIPFGGPVVKGALSAGIQGAGLGAASSIPSHIAETGRWELPSFSEAAGQTIGGGLFGGVLGAGHGLLGGGAPDVIPPTTRTEVPPQMGQQTLPGMENFDPNQIFSGPTYTKPTPPVNTPEPLNMQQARAFAGIEAKAQNDIFSLRVQQSEATRAGDHATATSLEDEILNIRMDVAEAKRNWTPPIEQPPVETPPPTFGDLPSNQGDLTGFSWRDKGKFVSPDTISPEMRRGVLGPEVGTMPPPTVPPPAPPQAPPVMEEPPLVEPPDLAPAQRGTAAYNAYVDQARAAGQEPLPYTDWRLHQVSGTPLPTAPQSDVVTGAMRQRLLELGFRKDVIDRLDAQAARNLINMAPPSSGRPAGQTKASVVESMAAKMESPARMGAMQGNEVPAGDEIRVPKVIANREYITNMEKNGYELSKIDGDEAVFVKALGDVEARIPSGGETSPEMSQILRRIFKPDQPLKTGSMNEFELRSAVGQIMNETDRAAAYQRTLEWHENVMHRHAAGDAEGANVAANISDLADQRYHELSNPRELSDIESRIPFSDRPPRQPLQGGEEIPEYAFQPDEGVVSDRESAKEFSIPEAEINQETETAPESRMNAIRDHHPRILEEAKNIYNETDPKKIVENLAHYSAIDTEVRMKYNEAQHNRMNNRIPIPEELHAAFMDSHRLKELAQAKYERASTRQLEGKDIGAKVPREGSLDDAFRENFQEVSDIRNAHFIMPDGTLLRHDQGSHYAAMRMIGETPEDALNAGIIRFNARGGAEMGAPITSKQAQVLADAAHFMPNKTLMVETASSETMIGRHKAFEAGTKADAIRAWVESKYIGDIADEVPDPATLDHPTAKRWAGIIRELDARNAPDSEYRDIFSTGAKNPLKKGQTWRDKALSGIDYFESIYKGDVSAHIPGTRRTINSVEDLWQTKTQIAEKGQEGYIRDSYVRDRENKMSAEDLDKFKNHPIVRQLSQVIDQMIHHILPPELQGEVTSTGILLDTSAYGMFSKPTRGDMPGAIHVNFPEMVRRFWKDPIQTARRFVSVVYHEAAHVGSGKPSRPFDIDAAKGDPYIGRFVRDYLNAQAGNQVLDHSADWAGRMIDLYERTGSEFAAKYEDGIRRILEGSAERTGKYSKQVQEAVLLYSRSRRAGSGEAGTIPRASNESGLRAESTRDVFSDTETDGVRVPSTSLVERVKGVTGWGQGASKGVKLDPNAPNLVKEMINLPTNATTFGDVSASGRQGLAMIFTPEFWKAMLPSLSAVSKGRADTIDVQLKRLPTFQDKVDVLTGKLIPSPAKEAGMEMMTLGHKLGPREEFSASRWIENGAFLGPEKIGGVPNPFRFLYQHSVGAVAAASNRIFTTFLNHLRANRFERLMNLSRNMAIRGEETGRTSMEGILGGVQFQSGKNIGFTKAVTPEQAAEINPFFNKMRAKEIADFVNTATGRGPLRTHLLPFKQAEINLEKSAGALGYVLFAPKNTASRVRMLNPNTYIMASPFVRKQYLKAALSTAAAWWTFTELAKNADPRVEVNHDLTSADFGKVRIGDFRLDPAGGFQQFLVAYARLYQGGSSSSATGEFHKFGEGYQAQTAFDMGERLFANKLNPVTKFAWDLANASQYNPFHVKDRAAQLFVPLVVQDFIEIQKEDPNLLMPWMIPILFGSGSQIYSKGESVSKFVSPENDWNVTGGGLKDLNPFIR